MDVGEYRKQVEQELERAAEQQTDFQIFLDRGSSLAQRSLAVEGATAAKGEDQVQATIDLVRDAGEPMRLRIAALDALSYEIGRSEKLIDMALDLVRDRSEPAALRTAAINALQQSSFSGPVFPAKRPEYLAALRSVVVDPDQELRRTAIEILAKESDEYVQRRLLEGLEDRKKALLPPAQAIQLLGYDIHAEHYPILRQIVRRPPNQAARREAVRLLATDASSKELLAELLGDKNENRETRKTSALALQSLAPAEFEDRAKQIVLDDDEDDQLRATCINALTHFANPAGLRQDASFGRRIEQLRQQTTSRQLRQAARQYMLQHSE